MSRLINIKSDSKSVALRALFLLRCEFVCRHVPCYDCSGAVTRFG